jgi:ferritin-like metal-binding protein YciE
MLLDVEPRLAKGFDKLAARAQLPRLKHFCREGVSYTNRRVERLKEAFETLGVTARRRTSNGLDGLIQDALTAARKSRGPSTDAAILATIERISHFGLAAYTTIDRYLVRRVNLKFGASSSRQPKKSVTRLGK